MTADGADSRGLPSMEAESKGEAASDARDQLQTTLESFSMLRQYYSKKSYRSGVLACVDAEVCAH